MPCYQPIHCSELLNIGTGKIAVITGWTIKEAVLSFLDTDDYCVVGNLYSRKVGINFLLKNLLFNPFVNTLVGIAATPMDKTSLGVYTLSCFFEKGYRIIKDDNNNKQIVIINDLNEKPVAIDKDITTEYLDRLRQNISFYLFDNVKDSCRFIKRTAASSLGNTANPCHPIKLDSAQPTFDHNPTFENGHLIRSDSLAKAWLRLNKLCLESGDLRPTRHGTNIKEILNTAVSIDSQDAITDYLDFKKNDFLPFSPSQANNYLTSLTDKANLSIEFGDRAISYTYAERIRSWFGIDQLQVAIAKLKNNQHETAVISLWDSARDLSNPQPPCLNHINLRIYQGRLFVTALFRSHDIFSAWYLNTLSLLHLQQQAALELNLSPTELGELTVISESAHIYESVFADCQKILNEQVGSIKNNTTNPNDRSGNFVLSIDRPSKQIMVRREFDGDLVGEYRGRNVKKITQAIAFDCPSLELNHALYLGAELQKAKTAIDAGLAYIQDRPLDWK